MLLQILQLPNTIKIEKYDKNFVISGQRQVEMFADAIEASANDQTPSIKVNATFLTDPKDIAKFMQKRKKANAGSK